MPPIESGLARYQTLPRSPDLARLREQAKSLKTRCASDDPDAIAFVIFHRQETHTAVKLADAQFALARSYGFKSWVRLKAFVEAQAHTPAERGEQLLNTLFTDNLWLLEELYQRRESLPSSDFILCAPATHR